MDIKEILEIKGYIINLVSMYPRTVAEVRKKLLKKGYQEENIEQSINELLQKKYLDDEEYARKWLNQQLENRPCGKLLCKSQMLKKGLAEDVVDDTIQRDYSDDMELEIAREVSKKKLNKLNINKNNSQDVQKRKLSFFLRNKGFSSGVIMEIINEEL